MTTPKHAKLRVCASCEWIFKSEHSESGDCPKCGFAHYSAHSVYEKAAYTYAITQQPWLNKKITSFTVQLHSEIHTYNEKHGIFKTKKHKHKYIECPTPDGFGYVRVKD